MPRIARTIAAAVGLCAGVIASQGPEFAQQYRQRLGGAIDELRRIVQRFDADAAVNDRGRESALAQLEQSPDELGRRQGGAMRANMSRLERLERYRASFIEAGPFGRLVIAARDPQVEVMRATYAEFEPAVPATQEGLVAAALGFLAGWGITLAVAGLWRRSRRAPRLRPAAPQ